MADSRIASKKWAGYNLRFEGKRLNDWQVGAFLAEGAYGAVFEAEHVTSHETAALKIMKPELMTLKRLERFQREGLVLRRLEHPNIVRSIETGNCDVLEYPIFYIALELLKGRTLEEEVAERGRLPEGYVLWIAQEVVSALAAVESHRIVHADLKPSNVFITDEGRVKVMDFGHSALLEFENLNSFGSFVGTAAFASPEQFVDSAQLDSRSDQYSLGCLLYFALTGSPPFGGMSIETLAAGHQKDMAVPIRLRNPQVSHFAQSLVNRLMAKKKTDRFASMDELAKVLQAQERSLFFYNLLPERHMRREAASFWSAAVFPRFEAPRCPMEPLSPLARQVSTLVDRLERGEGGTLLIQGDRGLGASRPLLEILQPRSTVQVTRGRVHYAGEPALIPLTRMLEGLFPRHSHAKFQWEEQFRHITNQPPDAWGSLRIFLRQPANYVENFGPDRDLRLAAEVGLVLEGLARDLPLVIIWDHVDQYEERMIALMLKLLPKLQQLPILSVCIGPRIKGRTAPDAGRVRWNALCRSIQRTGQRTAVHELAMPETAVLQKTMRFFFSDPAELMLVMRKSTDKSFRSFHEYFQWLAYWKETAHARKVATGEPITAQSSLGSDPLFEGSIELLYERRVRALPRTLQRALTVMAEEGESAMLPTPTHFRERVTGMDIWRMVNELERRWYIAVFRDHVRFRDPGLVAWLRANPVGR